MSNNISAMVIAAGDGPKAQVRTGTVSSATSSTVTVLVGGTAILAAYAIPFTSGTPVAPAPGDLVFVIRQDSSWVVMGKVAGVGSNLVENPSFELSTSGFHPALWNSYDVSGLSVAITQTVTDAVDGTQVAQVSSSQTSVHYLYSNPIAVTIGETWSLSAFVGAEYPAPPYDADAALFALWFANDTNLYPTTSSPDTSVATAADVVQHPPFTPLSGNVAVPVTGFMRVALRTSIISGQALAWDFVTARKVS